MRTSQLTMADATAGNTAAMEGFEFFPVTTTCRLIFEEGAHALVTVGSLSAYASAGRLAALTRWLGRRFEEIDIVQTDLHLASLFQAFGYSPQQAQRRAAMEGSALLGTIRQGVREAGPVAARVRVRALSDFADRPLYQLLSRRVAHLLKIDDELRQGCDHTVQQFLAPRLQDSGGPATERQLRAARGFVAAEVPFLVDTPGILGVPSSVSCHHVATPLADVLYGRGGGLRAMRNQAYAVVRPGRTVRDVAGAA